MPVRVVLRARTRRQFGVNGLRPWWFQSQDARLRTARQVGAL